MPDRQVAVDITLHGHARRLEVVTLAVTFRSSIVAPFAAVRFSRLFLASSLPGAQLRTEQGPITTDAACSGR